MTDKYITILLALVLLSGSVSAITTTPTQLLSRGDTLYVGGTGPGNYTRIQDAIDNSSDGGMVFVYDDSSPYNETIVIHKSILLQGENRDTTIIKGNENNEVVLIESSYVTIDDFTIQNKGTAFGYDGILIRGNNNHNTISNNNIFSCSVAIALMGDFSLDDGSCFNKIINNNLSNNAHGIFLWDGSNFNRVTGNIISHNKERGVFGLFSSWNIIKNNKINFNEWVGVMTDGIGNIYSYNEISFNVEEGVVLLGDVPLVNNKFICNNISNNGNNGIIVSSLPNPFFTRNNLIRHNIIDSNGIGISLQGGFKTRIQYNKINKNGIGVMIFGGIKTRVRNNDFTNNNQNAFYYTTIRTKWFGNYWNGSQERPYRIYGELNPFTFLENVTFPLVNFDWFPAKKPNNMEVET